VSLGYRCRRSYRPLCSYSLQQLNANCDRNTVGYKVSLGKNVAHNFVQYFLYPFTPHVSEIHTIFVLAPKWELLSAAAMHMFIIVMLCRWRVIYA